MNWKKIIKRIIFGPEIPRQKVLLVQKEKFRFKATYSDQTTYEFDRNSFMCAAMNAVDRCKQKNKQLIKLELIGCYELNPKIKSIDEVYKSENKEGS